MACTTHWSLHTVCYSWCFDVARWAKLVKMGSIHGTLLPKCRRIIVQKTTVFTPFRPLFLCPKVAHLQRLFWTFNWPKRAKPHSKRVHFSCVCILEILSSLVEKDIFSPSFGPKMISFQNILVFVGAKMNFQGLKIGYPLQPHRKTIGTPRCKEANLKIAPPVCGAGSLLARVKWAPMQGLGIWLPKNASLIN